MAFCLASPKTAFSWLFGSEATSHPCISVGPACAFEIKQMTTCFDSQDRISHTPTPVQAEGILFLVIWAAIGTLILVERESQPCRFDGLTVLSMRRV